MSCLLPAPLGSRYRGRRFSEDARLAAIASVNPYLSLDFIGKLYFKQQAPYSLASVPGYSFTRASAGYAQNAAGLLLPFASGAPRITDKGVLVEGARTNLCLQSQAFETASWFTTRASISANAATAPDGTLTADKLIEDTGVTTTHYLGSAAMAVVADSTFTVSVLLKAAGRGWARVNGNDNSETNQFFAYVNLATGAVGTTGGLGTGTFASARVQAMSDGWYRIAITGSLGGGITSARIRVNTANADSGINYTGDGSSGVHVWGAQLEAAAFESSYIPTVGASITRAADVLTFSSISGAYPWSLYAEFERVVDTGGSEVLFQVGPSANEECFLYVDSSDRFSGQVKTGGVMQANEFVTGALAVGTTYRGALRVASNDVKAARSGTLSTGDTSSTNPSAPTAIIFGNRFAQDLPSWGYIRRAALFNAALADARLQALTA